MPTTPNSDFAGLLRSAVDSYHLPQVEIARALGVTQQTVSRWLSSKADPSGDVVAMSRRLAELLEDHVADLPRFESRQEAAELEAFLKPLGGSVLFDLPPATTRSLEWWRDEDAQDLDDLGKVRRPLAILEVHPGHGATTAARRIEQNVSDRTAYTKIVPVRVGVELLLARANHMTEIEFYTASGSASDALRPILEPVPGVTESIDAAIVEAFAAHVEQIGDRISQSRVRSLLAAGDWRAVLSEQYDHGLYVVLDLSPSPFFRTLEDDVEPTFRQFAEDMVAGVGQAVRGLAKLTVTVIQSTTRMDQETLEKLLFGQVRNLEIEVRRMSRRSRLDLIEILALRAGVTRAEFTSAIESRLIYDPALGSLSRCAVQTRRTVDLTLGLVGDPGGAIRADDFGSTQAQASKALDQTGELSRQFTQSIARQQEGMDQLRAEVVDLRTEVAELKALRSEIAQLRDNLRIEREVARG